MSLAREEQSFNPWLVGRVVLCGEDRGECDVSIPVTNVRLSRLTTTKVYMIFA